MARTERRSFSQARHPNAESPPMSSQPTTRMHAGHQLEVTLPDDLPSPSIPIHPGSPILMGSHSEGSPMAENHASLPTDEELVTEQHQVISINMLPDEVILGVFYSCLFDFPYSEKRQNAWLLLVHVCRRWRTIVFGSPRHLGLQLVCTARTRAREMLDVWPALPLNIMCTSPVEKVDNIIAVLERIDRVQNMFINSSSDWDVILAAMQQPLPELTTLGLSHDETSPVVPDLFLGGSAPSLKYLRLSGVQFPGLPRLVLSATHFVQLILWSIPHSGYFSPDAAVNSFSALTSLESLILSFKSPRSCPDRASRRPPPLTRSVLPVLTSFSFRGVSEYLEDLVASIDAPQLDHSSIAFFNDVVFDTPQLIHFISRTPISRALEKAHIRFQDRAANLTFSSQTSGYLELGVTILCIGLDWQVSSLEQVCTSCSPLLSMLEDLYIYKCTHRELNWKGKIENRLWPKLLHPFAAVKNLYLSKEFASHIAPALPELVEGRMTETLITLQQILLEGLESPVVVEEGIGQFVAERQVAGHPITISHWVDSEKEMMYTDRPAGD